MRAAKPRVDLGRAVGPWCHRVTCFRCRRGAMIAARSNADTNAACDRVPVPAKSFLSRVRAAPKVTPVSLENSLKLEPSIKCSASSAFCGEKLKASSIQLARLGPSACKSATHAVTSVSPGTGVTLIRRLTVPLRPSRRSNSGRWLSATRATTVAKVLASWARRAAKRERAL
jgi:hypothetical protein